MSDHILNIVISEECVVHALDLPRDMTDDLIKSASVSITSCEVALGCSNIVLWSKFCDQCGGLSVQ